VDAAAEATPDELRIFIFRAVRELLFNVCKHARVSAARVRVSHNGANDLRIEVTDSGAGFDVSASKPVSLGLFNIRERAAHFGGRLDVRTEPGQGTSVTLTLPLAAKTRNGSP
jgi:signal transduction histidine kinase